MACNRLPLSKEDLENVDEAELYDFVSDICDSLQNEQDTTFKTIVKMCHELLDGYEDVITQKLINKQTKSEICEYLVD